MDDKCSGERALLENQSGDAIHVGNRRVVLRMENTDGVEEGNDGEVRRENGRWDARRQTNVLEGACAQECRETPSMWKSVPHTDPELSVSDGIRKRATDCSVLKVAIPESKRYRQRAMDATNNNICGDLLREVVGNACSSDNVHTSDVKKSQSYNKSNDRGTNYSRTVDGTVPCDRCETTRWPIQSEAGCNVEESKGTVSQDAGTHLNCTESRGKEVFRISNGHVIANDSRSDAAMALEMATKSLKMVNYALKIGKGEGNVDIDEDEVNIEKEGQSYGAERCESEEMLTARGEGGGCARHSGVRHQYRDSRENCEMEGY